MNFNLIKKNKGAFIVFLLLFSFNLGFKEVFRAFRDENSVYDSPFILFFTLLSIIFILISINLLKNYSIIYVLSIFLFLYFFISSLSTIDPTYGIQKSFLGLLLPITIFSLFVRIKWTKELISSSFVLFTIILSIIAIIFKLKFGFFDRSVSFGVIGSIPFGWVNGFAFFIIALKKTKKLTEYLLMLYFLSMVLWTGSKGPLLAMVIILILNFNNVLGSKISTKIITFTTLILIIYIINIYAEDFRAIRSLIAFFEAPEEYSEGVGRGSIGTRYVYFSTALNMFLENPLFGNGFGSFVENTLFHKYPHNIYVEILAETGLFSFIFFIFIILKSSIKGIGQGVIFILICLSFSGDFSYFRYAFYPLLISTFIHKNYIK